MTIISGFISQYSIFGYKTLIQETEEQIITGYEVLEGNPSDENLLSKCLDRHEALFGKAPWGVATDRGFVTKDNEKFCTQKGIKCISLLRKGTLSKKQKAKQKQLWFK